MNSDSINDGDSVIPVLEETARVDVRQQVIGRTRVTTQTQMTTEDVEASLETHSVSVTRVPVGRDLDPDEPLPVAREDGDTTILPVFEEVLVVEKRLRLVEEVHITRSVETEDVRVPVTLRRQTASIDRDDPGDNTKL